jgi:hypothetical protein
VYNHHTANNNHSITYVLSRRRVATCAVVYVVSAREHSRRARCRAWFFPLWGKGAGVRVRLLLGWDGFMGGWFLKGRQRSRFEDGVVIV